MKPKDVEKLGNNIDRCQENALRSLDRASQAPNGKKGKFTKQANTWMDLRDEFEAQIPVEL